MTAPETPRRIAFHAAASTAIGGGHIVRSVSLANALAAQGIPCVFFVNEQTERAAPLLARSRHQTVTVSGDTRHVLEQARKNAPFDWVVIDNYALAAADEKQWRGIANKILVIDDLANRGHDCDILLDSAPSRHASDYVGQLAPATRLLLGPVYAPLRSEFAHSRPKALFKREMTIRPERLLVSFGLTDPGTITCQAVTKIAESLPSLAMDVVVGSGTESWRIIHALGRPNITLHSDPASMSDLMVAADIALGAGGSTAWERVCLGLPSVVQILADNQRNLADKLAQQGALSVVRQKNNWPAVIEALARLCDDQEAWHAMSRRAATICDGRGADRVALEMDPPLSRRGLPVRLRPATVKDTEQVFHWQSAPGAREFSSNPNPPTHAEHLAWMAKKLDEPRCVFSIITEGDVPVGIFRLDQRQDGSFMVSILVADNARNCGVAGAALSAGTRLMRGADLWARIDRRNTPSLRAFQNAGFLPQGEDLYYRASMR